MAKRPLSSDEGDVWRRDEDKIRKRIKDHTVKEVKTMMERDENFPVMALATWNEKLGDLGIRKNVSSEEWRIIYGHILPMLEDPTRQLGDLKAKRLKKGFHIEIIVRGRTYTWNEVWKNMKRVLLKDSHPPPKEPLGQIPSEFVIRVLENRPTSTNIDWKTEALSIAPYDHFGPGLNEPMVEYAERDWRICLAGLPIGAVIHHTIDIENLVMPSSAFLQGFRQNPNSTVQSTWSLSRALNTTESGASTRLHWSLSHQLLSVVFGKPSTDLTTRTSHYKHYVELFTIIYFLSNNHTHISLFDNDDPQSIHYGLFRQLDSIFADLSAKYLEELLYRRLASIRAAFEILVMLSGRYKQKQAFRFLVNVGTTYKWLDISGKSQDLLAFAASMDLKDTLRTLLRNGCRPDSSATHHAYSSQYETTAIVEAFKNENFDCAKLLLKHCDINRNIRIGRSPTMTNFDYFLVHLAGQDELLKKGLELFIRKRLDLNVHVSVLQSYKYGSLGSAWLPKYEELPKFSILDYLFYFQRRLFDEFSPMAPTQGGQLSRAAVLFALENGTGYLQQYLDDLDQKIDQQCLDKLYKQLILEQFLICDFEGRKRATDLKVVHALVDFGTIAMQALCQWPQFLQRFVIAVGKEWPTHELEALKYLLDNGATVGEDVIWELARLPDTRPLELIGGGMANPREKQIVLISAAARNDFATAERLVKAGVDLETDIWYSDGMNRHSIIAHVMDSWPEGSNGLPKMLDFLVKNGAPLRFSARRSHLYHLLHSTIRQSCHLSEQDLLGTVEYIVDAGYDPSDSSFPSASLLKACEGQIKGIKVFEYLFNRGAQLQPGSPLTIWIRMGGGIGLVREMLEAGVDLQAYHAGGNLKTTPLQAAAKYWKVDIVEELVRAGAKVNAPAIGTFGLTALQASCSGAPRSSEQQQQKLRTVDILLAAGANVNADPARTGGVTALQAAAESGDLALAKLLLFRQHKADVNAPPCQRASHILLSERNPIEPLGNALDLAAGNGRIDMVKLLLNCNALSHRRGKTGYDGAINMADKNGHLAVADLIRQHAERSGTKNPYLSEPQRDCREYSYVLGPCEDSEYSEEEPYSGSWSSSEERVDSEDEADSESEAGSVASFDTDQQDQSEAACGLDGHNSTQPPTHDESTMDMAQDRIIGSDWEIPLPADGHDSAARGEPPHPFKNSVSCDPFMGFNMSPDI